MLFADGVPRRVGFASFALNFYLGGLRPLGYHLVNVLLHAANGFLLYWVGSSILGRLRPDLAHQGKTKLAAMVAAFLWLVHPVQTQAVSYVYQRFTVLSSFFFLLALGCWVEARRRRTGARVMLYGVSLGSGVLALGTKEIAATLPFFLLLLAVWVFRDELSSWERRDVGLVIGCIATTLALSALYLGPNFVAMMAGDYARRGFSLSERLLTEPRVVVHYLSLLAFPHPSRLTLDYDYPLSTGLLSPPTTCVALVFLSVTLVYAVVRARAHPLFSFSALWFLGNLAIESTFIPLDLAYEHRIYLPSMMLFVWIAAELLGLASTQRLRRLSTFVVVLLACVWSVWTYQRNIVWRDPVSLWEDNARKSPAKARVHANLGTAYLARGRNAEAGAALERALELDSSLPEARVSLANLYIDSTQRWDEARRLLEGVIAQAPSHAPAYVGLGVIHLRSGEYARAAELFEMALARDESNPEALFNLGAARFNDGDYASAVVVLALGVEYWPEDARLHALLGAALVEVGDLERAVDVLRRALLLEPGDAMANRYLARASQHGLDR